ncbi:MAG: M28 family peptidase, partial [Colwellia sp.]|nr:M28 family peptidase [Colwellia sp.]
MLDDKKMTKSLSTLFVKLSVLIISLAIVNFAGAEINKISLTQVTKDVSYLASDDLKGRSNYSPEIRLAADYIAKRFQESGLVAADNISGVNFLQKYQVTKTTPKEINLTINGQNITDKNLAVASTIANFSWEMDSTEITGFEIHNVSESDDARLLISMLNNRGGKHLVLLNPAHEALFKRYQVYLQQGTTKLSQDNSDNDSGGIIVIVLSTMTAKDIKTLKISGASSINKSELINVVAILPGKTKPEDIVLYSAHYDHLGVKVGEGDVIFNGADDDASGTTA